MKKTNRRMLCAGWVAMLSLSATLNAQTTWYVDLDATGANDGSSWSDAFVDLKSGLLFAASGDAIQVAEGAYTPDQGSLLRTATFAVSGQSVLGESQEWARRILTCATSTPSPPCSAATCWETTARASPIAVTTVFTW